MNRHLETARKSAGSDALIADLTPAPNRTVDRSRQPSASNDAAQEKPIKAIDAMALCMADSAIGG